MYEFTFFSCGALNRFQVMAYPSGASRSHSLDTPQSVGLLWISDQPDAETSTRHHTTLTTDNTDTPAGFTLTVPASQRPQTYALDRAATGISHAFTVKYTDSLCRLYCE
jgi:hypothetical protein